MISDVSPYIRSHPNSRPTANPLRTEAVAFSFPQTQPVTVDESTSRFADRARETPRLPRFGIGGVPQYHTFAANGSYTGTSTSRSSNTGVLKAVEFSR
jgi:hypothetical protein